MSNFEILSLSSVVLTSLIGLFILPYFQNTNKRFKALKDNQVKTFSRLELLEKNTVEIKDFVSLESSLKDYIHTENKDLKKELTDLLDRYFKFTRGS